MPRKPSLLVRLSLGAASLVVTVSAATIILVATGRLLGSSGVGGVAELYKTVRQPIFKLIFGTDFDPPWSGVLLDGCALWISLFAAINVFVYRNEGVLLWGHIRRNYCSRAAPTFLGSGLCALTKLIFALAATPVACAQMYLVSLQSEHTLHTSCYITLDPKEIARYLRIMGMSIVVLVGAVTLIARYMPV